ncbi:hypothetical protein E4U33_000584 [Claviceps sp. LM78 group G4]|nr:hypothetical protein E4U33_000584 [Claviceps sp. LM78 group G4]
MKRNWARQAESVEKVRGRETWSLQGPKSGGQRDKNVIDGIRMAQPTIGYNARVCQCWVNADAAAALMAKWTKSEEEKRRKARQEKEHIVAGEVSRIGRGAATSESPDSVHQL